MRALSLFLLLGAATAALRSTATICNKDDAAALLKLRAATAGDTWTITWPGADPCPLTQNARYIRTHGRTVTILANPRPFRAGTSCTSRAPSPTCAVFFPVERTSVVIRRLELSFCRSPSFSFFLSLSLSLSATSHTLRTLYCCCCSYTATAAAPTDYCTPLPTAAAAAAAVAIGMVFVAIGMVFIARPPAGTASSGHR